jgi:hypothetical protein
MTRPRTTAQGWFWDPYHRHQDRYFSDGRPTKLVRDGGQESFDPPPDLPVPGSLVPALPAGDAAASASARRAGGDRRDGAYDRFSARDAAISAMVRYGAAR